MTPGLKSMVAVTYVRDIDTSRAFYGLLGFHEEQSGAGPASGWLVLQQNGHSVLLASSRPPLDIPPLPLLFYFFVDDLDALVTEIRAAGAQADHLGYPPHAARRRGQAARPGPQHGPARPGRAAGIPGAAARGAGLGALLAAERGRRPRPGRRREHARLPGRQLQGAPCDVSAEVKLADTAGNTVWACLRHADEILVTVPAAFIASQDEGIAGFLSHRG